MNRRTKMTIFLMVVATTLSIVATGLLWLPSALAVEPSSSITLDSGLGLGLLAAALATGLSALGAGYAVGTVGAAAVGALTEKPELLGRMLILIGLAEGIAIYGLLISILIFNRIA
ncbi:MAG: ATP synthase subunit C [Acidiferrobacterales bacterium]